MKILFQKERKTLLPIKTSDERESLHSRLTLYFIFVAMIKYPNKDNLRKKGFTLAPNSRLQYIIAGKPRQQRLESVSRIHSKEQGKRRKSLHV